ncbi:GNAT family N-acetyltransferase [Bacillus sp. CGMCC 1.16607]|uniref:GNAT family N-acetyltransferase n=1 Tax=Bacillus sp. CGMCC 1.16607 TaxID=3351842 RepID=UPI003635DCAA
MAIVKKGIEIVQYHEGWAKEVAKMWNLSRDGWGGDTRVMTEDQVKQKEANSDNIELYLAIDGEEVVGYCGLSEYKEDTGSLYIPLLNVRPDYQSQKIGKKLLLKALEKTIELGWPRLDLYTWPGNTKAVPLYKKCGFFWEDRDDTTHLMNFIPQVLQTSLLKPVFQELDWYESSERLIEVKPDGTKENGFTFYEYSWKNNSQFVRVQFERTSRGMNLIETNEFLLKIQLAEHEIIEQQEQKFQITFINKSTTPATLQVNGSGNDRLKYQIKSEMIVQDEAILLGLVTAKQGDEPSPWRTHPTLSVNVTINGHECELKLGVFPKPPAKLSTTFQGNLCYLNKENFFDLEIKNNLQEEIEYTLHFPESELVELENSSFKVILPKNSRNTISIPFIVKNYGFYKPNISVIAKMMNSTEFQFEQEINVALKGLGEKFGGESKDYWHIYNGLSQINVRKRDLLITVAKNSDKKQPFAFLPPKLGKPYTNEFTKKKPNAVTWELNASSIILKIALESDDMEDVHLSQNLQLFGDGIVYKWIEIENKGKKSRQHVAISSSLYHEMDKTYFPIEEKVIYFSENRILEYGDLKPSSITGNWYFSENNPEPIGVAWSNRCKASPEGWQFVIEDDLGIIEPGCKASTEKVIVSVGAFGKWEDFRAFVSQSQYTEKFEVFHETDFEVNNFIIQDSKLSITLNTYRNSYLDGKIQVTVNDSNEYQGQLDKDEEKTSHSFDFQSDKLTNVSIIQGEFKTNSMTTQLEELILLPTKQLVYQHSETIHSLTSFEVNNGCITIQTAPDFYPGLYSIKVNGYEWLDYSFPEVTAKGWWNPWAGGMKTAPNDLNTFSLMKEKHTASPVDKLDLQGNKWSGVAIRTEINEHPEWKGVQYVQYYLMLPGIPVIATILEVENTGGKNLKSVNWNTDFFLGGEDLSNLSVETNNYNQTKQYKAGIQEFPIHLDQDHYFTSVSKKEKLYIVPSLYTANAESYTNKDALHVLYSQTAKPGKDGHQTAPLFMLFDERNLSAQLLEKLRRIQF